MSDENHVMLSVDELTCVLTLVLKRVRCRRTVTSPPLLIIYQSYYHFTCCELLLMVSCRTLVSRFPANYLYNYHMNLLAHTYHIMYVSIAIILC